MTMGALIAKLAAVSAVMLAGSPMRPRSRSSARPARGSPTRCWCRASRRRPGTRYVTAWGGVNEVAKRVGDGETADVVMLPAAQIDGLIKQGKLVPDSAGQCGDAPASASRSAPARRRSTSASSEGIQKALLAAKTIAYSGRAERHSHRAPDREMGPHRPAQVQDRSAESPTCPSARWWRAATPRSASSR